MEGVGRIAIVLGIVLVVAGIVITVTGRLGLPGDVTYRRGDFTLYFPLATSIVISILLTVVLNVLLRR